jgi:AcrR family transcriptional regulator
MSPRTKLAYGRIRKERIDQIIEAAYHVFSSNGYTATMIEDISNAAGISKGLIYHYFSSKEELFTVLVKRAMEGALTLIQDALTRSGSPWDRLHWLASEIVSRARQEPEEFLVIMQAYTTSAIPQEVRAMAIQYVMSSSQAIRELIEEGRKMKQVIEGDPEILAMTLTACLQGLVLNAIIPLYQVSDLLNVDIVLRMLKP